MTDTVLLDNFNRADANPAGGWTGIANALQILSNQGAMTAATSAAYLNWATYGADCEFSAQIPTMPADGQTIQIGCRMKDVGYQFGLPIVANEE